MLLYTSGHQRPLPRARCCRPARCSRMSTSSRPSTRRADRRGRAVPAVAAVPRLRSQRRARQALGRGPRSCSMTASTPRRRSGRWPPRRVTAVLGVPASTRMAAPPGVRPASRRCASRCPARRRWRAGCRRVRRARRRPARRLRTHRGGTGRHDERRGQRLTGRVDRCPLPGVEAELRDADGERRRRRATRAAFHPRRESVLGLLARRPGRPRRRGWFGTGDIAVADADGELHLVGRSTELVIVNGFNVYPAEVEAVLAATPRCGRGRGDRRAGRAHRRGGRAYVVPRGRCRTRRAELLVAAAGSLARFKLPARLEMVAAMPRTVTGKIMKWQLGPEGETDGSR